MKSVNASGKLTSAAGLDSSLSLGSMINALSSDPGIVVEGSAWMTSYPGRSAGIRACEKERIVNNKPGSSKVQLIRYKVYMKKENK